MKSKIILAAAAAVFTDYPNENEVHVTQDGSAFLSRNLAENHARDNKWPAPESVTREDIETNYPTLTERAVRNGQVGNSDAGDGNADGSIGGGENNGAVQSDASASAAPPPANAEELQVPTEPGYYADKDGAHWQLTKAGNWSWKKTGTDIDRSDNRSMIELAPFTRIEKP